MSAPIPKDEAKRLKVLWQYDVLDTVPEEVFDELTDLAAHICGAPIALITFVDENRQWFKSKTGTSINESGRDISICAHAIMQDKLFIVPDTTLDVRFRDNPLVTGSPKIRFYAGAPLISPEGYALGTLCVLDKVSRELTADQKQALHILARHVMTLLKLRRHALGLGKRSSAPEKMQTEVTKAQPEIIRLQNKSKPRATSVKRPKNSTRRREDRSRH